MEHLFSTNIELDKQEVKYNVVFDHEKYVFTPEANNKAFRSFSLRREHDEWRYDEFIPAGIIEQAVDALENYLLRQH
jgi:hypothetical protein